MQSARVVPALDVLEDGASKSGSRRPSAGIDELALDGGEEALGHCIVPALALAPDREDDAVGPGQLGKVTARILTAPVGMKDHAPLWCTVGERHGEGVGDQLGAHVIGQGPPDHPTGLPGR